MVKPLGTFFKNKSNIILNLDNNRAPRFRRTCDKELSGLIHIRSILESLNNKYDFKDETILKFIEEIEKE